MAERKKGKGGQAWSKDEVKLLKELFRNTTTKEVAQKLQRSVPSVQAKASALGLKKTKKHVKLVRGGK